MKRLIFETDWLASQPVFYNEKTGQASHNINDVIDYANLEFHSEGFNNYLDFGYSVLEQTPVNHVKFLRHSSALWLNEQGRLSVEYLADPVEQGLDYRLPEEDVINLIRERVREWERSVEGEIIIPTSGGYDSRLLNWCIEDKSRIRSFTYGISENQAKSYEVVYARRLSEILGTCWEQIPIGDFHQYFDEWDQLFGVSTHAHGMYHFEFYQKMLPKVKGGNPLLSGIIGDAWAGTWNVKRLGFNHGMQADSAKSLLQSNRPILERYYIDNRERLGSPLVRVVEAMRFKMILLSYIIAVPKVFGFKPWSPYLQPEIALSMLTLPPNRRNGRLWQQELFRQHGLDVESKRLKVNKSNYLNLQALRRQPLKPLNARLLSSVIQADYVEWINNNVGQASLQILQTKLLRVRKVGGALRRLGFKDATLTAYFAYLVLRPIENLLKARDRVAHGENPDPQHRLP